MRNGSREKLCIFDILDGLREGLSHFSNPSRVALIYAAGPEGPLRVCDPQELLRGHEPRLREIFYESDAWKSQARPAREVRHLEEVRGPDFPMQLTGLISFAAMSRSVFFQAWFTEEHPDMCSIGPTRCWLEHAARLLARNLFFDDDVNIGTSAYVLQEYASHAVRDFIVDQRNVKLGPDTGLRIFPTLDAILGVSRTLEEGAWPWGQLVFVEPGRVGQIEFMALFPVNERPRLVNHKHVRKLLQAVENSDRKLVSDGREIIGVSKGPVPLSSVIAEFRGGHGFVCLDDELICSFCDGRYYSSTRKANLVQVEEALLETGLDLESVHEIYSVISYLVHTAGELKHGCTLVVDFNRQPIRISGQNLASPLDLRQRPFLELAGSLAKVDGALHIGADLKLHGFACLLDGHAVPGENRSRGARYNSALRFTSENSEMIVVVVSVDRPVSVIRDGVELTAQCEWSGLPACVGVLPRLDIWLEG